MLTLYTLHSTALALFFAVIWHSYTEISVTRLQDEHAKTYYIGTLWRYLLQQKAQPFVQRRNAFQTTKTDDGGHGN
jgi:hypothetical protein